MEQKRASIVCSERHIPEELRPNILSRLPAKSLLRFRCVSKSWLSLFGDPDFCRLHLNNFKNNRDETHLLLVDNDSPKRYVVQCSKTFKTSIDLLPTLPKGVWNVGYSFDGLVLLKRYEEEDSELLDDSESPDYEYRDLKLWNPSIRKFHDIPSLPGIETTGDSLCDADIGLGYDLLAKDYKHVKLIYGGDDCIVRFVAIYTLGVASWKIIPFQGNGFCDWVWDMHSGAHTTVYLQGSLYFLAKDPECDISELVSIDLSSEVFSRTSMPTDDYYDGPLILVDGGSSLAVLDFSYDYVNMWVLGREEPMRWTRRFSLSLRAPRFSYVKKDGDMLMWWAEKTSFSLGTGKQFLQKWWTLISSYNFETQDERRLMQRKDRELGFSDIYDYTESLILLK